MTAQRKRGSYYILLACTALTLLLGACTFNATQQSQVGKSNTSSLSGANNSSSQPITYNTGAQDLLIRTFYGGGNYGSLEFNPDISIYGDGTYILGADRQGKLDDTALQNLLRTLTDTYGLLDFKRQQFSDIQDQNATFLQITLSGKRQEFVYGSFGNQQETAQDMDEYHRLEKVLTTISDSLKGPTQPYTSKNVALLVHQNFSQDQQLLTWPITDFTLAQAAAYECGLLPPDTTSHNPETGCLKYLIPHSAILLTEAQAQAIRGLIPAQQQTPLPQALFTEDNTLFYTVTLRPLLPDELASKSLAMFGSAQDTVTPVPLLNGQVPPVPTPTPSK